MQIFNIKKIFVVDCTLALWMLSSFIIAIIPRNFLINFTYVILSLIALLAITRFNSKVNRGNNMEGIFIYFITTFIPLVIAIINGKYSFLYYWMLGANTVLAIKCLVQISLPSQMMIARLLIISCFAIGGVVAINDSVEIDSVSFIGGSSNLLSAALIAVVCWYGFVRLLAGHKEPILVAFLLFIFTIYLGGRSGIAISFGILLISVLFRASRSNIFFLLVSLILPLLAWFFLADVFFDIVDGTRLRHGFEDDVRSSIIQEYIRGIGPISLLIGGEFDPSGIITSYGGNPHNSIIRAHYMFGIFPIALFALALIYSAVILLSLPSRVSAYGFALGGLILLRSFYDSVTFWLELDFISLILLLNPIILSAQVKRKKNRMRHGSINLGIDLQSKFNFVNRSLP
jgi:hypothetical protein